MIINMNLEIFEKQRKLFRDNFYNMNDLLYHSASEGELALVIWSIKEGAYHYEEALEFASANNKLDVVKYLLNTIPDIDINFNNGGPLRLGNSEIVKFLVENGADINIGDPLYRAILSYRANPRGEKELELIKYLLEKGVNISEKSLSLARDSKEIMKLIK